MAIVMKHLLLHRNEFFYLIQIYRMFRDSTAMLKDVLFIQQLWAMNLTEQAEQISIVQCCINKNLSLTHS